MERNQSQKSIMFAWSVIGLTSTLMVVGVAFFAYAFAHLP